MNLSHLSVQLHSTLNHARTKKGWSWSTLSKALHGKGWKITPGNLATRHSRMAFRADELLVLMQVLDIAAIGADGRVAGEGA